LGHSHGGLVLSVAAGRGLEDVSGLVLSAPYLRSRMAVPAYKTLAARLIDPVVPWLPIASGLKREWMSSDDAMVQDSGRDPMVLRTATPRWYLGSIKAQEEAMRLAPQIRLPALVLIPGADPVADPRTTHDFFERLGSADKTCRVYPDHLHELLREARRETIFRHILDWLRERSDSSTQTF
jgi:lysophospholipase